MIKIKDTELRRYKEIINGVEHTVIVFYSQEKWWTVNDLKHREDDLPAVIDELGSKYWYKNNKLHRENDLPAVISNIENIEEWYIEGLLHRENAKPAFIDYKTNEEAYYFNGEEITKEDAMIKYMSKKLNKF